MFTHVRKYFLYMLAIILKVKEKSKCLVGICPKILSATDGFNETGHKFVLKLHKIIQYYAKICHIVWKRPICHYPTISARINVAIFPIHISLINKKEDKKRNNNASLRSSSFRHPHINYKFNLFYVFNIYYIYRYLLVHK